jgi:serine/threonine protein kinase/tetratricopeptide (TPR) repeat protein
MKCPNCQTENLDTSKFCKKCGQSLKTEVICQHCQHKNSPDSEFCVQCGQRLSEQAPLAKKVKPRKPSTIEPTSFADGRYQVKKLLGEGGKKKVYLAHDTLLDRDVAFALIKTEKLNEVARTRITREAQAMGRLGDHPNIGSVYDIGEYQGQPYIVQPYISGGDVEGLIEKAPEHRLTLNKIIDIAKAVCRGLVFAHSKGIIHRDLKPGNVMLTEDGTAKIVDFGLAVAVDLSRLTQSGMMVGTVSYMPPEQAMGGKVTAQADLYSLGAMFYEMVTGRPPFVGDDSVSIIGQHINTPPVAPTWHRADLPPVLETLILQLLEKDPSKRPSSAADVLQALESIDAVKSETTKKTSVVTENPIYQKVFVGREPELRQLQSAFDGAISGQGTLMMVVGEPGIGKTAICDQLRTHVTLRGGKTLLGHCYEEGSLSLPYLAFVEAMRSYVLSREAKDLREELGTGAADVARIVSEIRERLNVKPRPKGDAEEERYRLMQSVTCFLSNAANVQPLLIVLEDLHDSDKGTLDMLIHISRHLAGTRLLIVGTYRDVEVDRSHPLSAALAELRRLSSYGRVLLRGLNADEVRRMLERITQEEIPWGLAEAVYRQTEGNPLFVQEVVRYLAEEGLITQKEGRWRPSRDTPLEMSIPEGLRDVIGKRLSLLSPECNLLLSMAAVIGREFALDTLGAVANITEEAFVNALKEAVQLSVLEERSQVGSIRYRFTHAFFRQTLYEELIAPQRLQLHQQVARALETQYEKRLEEHAAELAEHFSQSTDPADLKKAVEYGEMAATRAVGVYAYGEAVRLLEQTIKVQKVLDPDNKAKQCDLLLLLGDALSLAGEPQRAYEIILPEAFSLAVAIGDRTRTSHTCKLAIDALLNYQAGVALATPEAAEWAERADHYSDSGTIDRVWADMCLGLVRCVTEHQTDGVPLIIRSVNLARQLDDLQAFWESGYYYLWQVQSPQHADERLRLAEELAEKSRTGVKVTTIGMASLFIALTLMEAGQRERAEAFLKELREIAERTGWVNLVLLSVVVDYYKPFMDGYLEETLDVIQRTQDRARALGLPSLADLLAGTVGALRPRLYLAHTDDELRTALESILDHPLELLPLAFLGHNDEVNDTLEKQVVNRPGFGTSEDELPAWKDVIYLETAVMVKNRQAVELLMQRLCGTSVCGMMKNMTCTSRYLGDAAAFLGKPDEAREHYQVALDLAYKLRSRPEIALIRLQLAELLLEHYPDEKKEAREYLDFSINEFREMKMQPALERALRHKDILKA